MDAKGKLGPGEVVLGGSGEASHVLANGGFLLTNQRVVKVRRSPVGGEGEFHAFTLEKLDSVRVVVKDPSWMLGVVILLVVHALFDSFNGFSLSGAVLVGLLYAGRRSKLVEFRSGASTMALRVTSMANEDVRQLVASVETAKQARLNRAAAGERETSDTPRNTPASDTRTARERLEALNELLAAGLIEQAEFDQRRRVIVGEL